MKNAEATNRLIFMLTKDKMPYNTVHKEGFITYSNYLNSKYQVPDRKKSYKTHLRKVYGSS